MTDIQAKLRNQGQTGVRAGRQGRTIADEIYETLHQRILTGGYLPGKRLSPTTLSSELGVSSTVIREALTRLVADGLVQSQSQLGFAVVSMTEADLRDLALMRILIDGEGLRRSMRVGGVAWQSRVVAAHHLLANTPARLPDGSVIASEAHQEAHADFHHALISGCGSPRLISQSRTLYAASELYRRLSRPLNSGKRANAVEHRVILEAVLKGDENLAVEKLQEHYERTIEILIASNVVDKGAT
jgi:DNA-binding GntR family transcriptional regulator